MWEFINKCILLGRKRIETTSDDIDKLNIKYNKKDRDFVTITRYIRENDLKQNTPDYANLNIGPTDTTTESLSTFNRRSNLTETTREDMKTFEFCSNPYDESLNYCTTKTSYHDPYFKDERETGAVSKKPLELPKTHLIEDTEMNNGNKKRTGCSSPLNDVYYGIGILEDSMRTNNQLESKFVSLNISRRKDYTRYGEIKDKMSQNSELKHPTYEHDWGIKEEINISHDYTYQNDFMGQTKSAHEICDPRQTYGAGFHRNGQFIGYSQGKKTFSRVTGVNKDTDSDSVAFSSYTESNTSVPNSFDTHWKDFNKYYLNPNVVNENLIIDQTSAQRSRSTRLPHFRSINEIYNPKPNQYDNNTPNLDISYVDTEVALLNRKYHNESEYRAKYYPNHNDFPSNPPPSNMSKYTNSNRANFQNITHKINQSRYRYANENITIENPCLATNMASHCYPYISPKNEDLATPPLREGAYGLSNYESPHVTDDESHNLNDQHFDQVNFTISSSVDDILNDPIYKDIHNVRLSTINVLCRLKQTDKVKNEIKEKIEANKRSLEYRKQAALETDNEIGEIFACLCSEKDFKTLNADNISIIDCVARFKKKIIEIDLYISNCEVAKKDFLFTTSRYERKFDLYDNLVFLGSVNKNKLLLDELIALCYCEMKKINNFLCVLKCRGINI